MHLLEERHLIAQTLQHILLLTVFPGLEIQSITTRTEQTGAMPATKTVNTGFTVTLPYNAVGNITGGGENIYVSPMIRGIL